MDEARIKQLLNMGLNGDDIIHGELKVWMLDAEDQLRMAEEQEEETEEAIDSMERKYWEGYNDALGAVYKLTYDIAFARGNNEA